MIANVAIYTAVTVQIKKQQCRAHNQLYKTEMTQQILSLLAVSVAVSGSLAVSVMFGLMVVVARLFAFCHVAVFRDLLDEIEGSEDDSSSSDHEHGVPQIADEFDEVLLDAMITLVDIAPHPTPPWISRGAIATNKSKFSIQSGNASVRTGITISSRRQSSDGKPSPSIAHRFIPEVLCPH